MKKTFLIFSTIALAFLVNSCCTQEAVDVKAEIEEANIAFMEAMNNYDAEALKNIYLPDLKVYPPNMDAMSGAEQVVPMMTANSSMGVKMKFETVSAMAYGTTAIEEGKYEVFVGEDTVVDYGKYIVIWKKKGDEWKISRDIWNTSMPLPPKPETSEELEEVQ